MTPHAVPPHGQTRPSTETRALTPTVTLPPPTRAQSIIPCPPPDEPKKKRALPPPTPPPTKLEANPICACPHLQRVSLELFIEGLERVGGVVNGIAHVEPEIPAAATRKKRVKKRPGVWE